MTIKTIQAQEAKRLLEENQAILIDVREKDEYEAQHIPNSLLIPLSKISYSRLPDSNGKTIIIHCKSGRRSTLACEKLLSERTDLDIHNLEGGIEAWAAAGFEVDSETSAKIPLMRQVFIVAGSFVLIGIILSQFIHHNFIIISEIVGAGLIFSGVTGWCGMAMILEKMPWNKK